MTPLPPARLYSPRDRHGTAAGRGQGGAGDWRQPGIGREIALTLAREGAAVGGRLSPDTEQEALAAALLAELRGLGAGAVGLPADIALTRALLRRRGWRVPTGSAGTFSRRVMALLLPGRLLSEVAPLLAVMQTVNQQLAYSDEVIEAVPRPDARVQRLQTVPCVGPVTAAALVATIDDAQRFHRAMRWRRISASSPGS